MSVVRPALSAVETDWTQRRHLEAERAELRVEFERTLAQLTQALADAPPRWTRLKELAERLGAIEEQLVGRSRESAAAELLGGPRQRLAVAVYQLQSLI